MEQFTTKLKVGDFRLDTTENLVIGEAGVLNELTESQVKVLKVLAVAGLRATKATTTRRRLVPLPMSVKKLSLIA